MRRLIAQARVRLGVRIWIASALLLVLIGGFVGALASAVGQVRHGMAVAGQHRQVLVASHGLERLVDDVETGGRGYVITGDPIFLRPWQRARTRFAPDATGLVRLAQAHSAMQGRQAAQIKQDGESFIRGFSEPLVRIAQRDRTAAAAIVALQAADRRVHRLTGEFRAFRADESRLAATGDESLAGADRAVYTATGGAIASILLVLAVGGYLARALTRPVLAYAMAADAPAAGEPAAGDQDSTVPTTGQSGTGPPQRPGNAMAITVRTSLEEQTAARARAVAAADATRRRIERDLHTRIQQRLASLTLTLRGIERNACSDHADVARQLAEVVADADDISGELREISRGIHPMVLSLGGLQPAVKALTRRCPIPVTLDFAVDGKLAEPLETTVYHLLCGALTNAVEYARASEVRIDVRTDATRLRAVICDDGTDPPYGPRLIGLRDRVEALGGEFTIDSPPGGGTTLTARIPTTPAPLGATDGTFR